MITKYENKKLCKKCGGNCCKTMGCHFSPDDFSDLSFEALKEEIQKGHISIDWWVGDIDEKKNRYSKTYYLRMRNVGEKIIQDSWGGQCALWNKKTGCPLPFEKRPKGARFLIPAILEPVLKIPGRCVSEYTKEMCVMDWRKYHAILNKLAKFFSKEEKHG